MLYRFKFNDYFSFYDYVRSKFSNNFIFVIYIYRSFCICMNTFFFLILLSMLSDKHSRENLLQGVFLHYKHTE